ncbi:hypothetical protein CVIRNUC_002699 [Coccomyxa viridis]|uniref:CDAN1-interacting nuclease 1 n=1 Tax=Coccomyxa viridis TaxID=1274662 RepID=A0AAV1I062_9CHLO|nr:hypothetical protein CVIRNUC_002699 [Coccomyxa viridis]
MNSEQYAEFESLLPPLGSVPNLELFAKRLRVPYDVLSAAHAQAAQLQSWKNHISAKHRLPGLYKRYVSGETLAELACEAELPPCLLVRRFLELIPEAQGLKATHVLRNPKLLSSLPDGHAAAAASCEVPMPMSVDQQGLSAALLSRLQADIMEAAEWDTVSSPQADLMRSVLGQEYEAILAEKLRCANIAFFSEGRLRQEGFFKTPDVKLEVPVLMHGQVVTWIDSKAMFGSERYHMQQQELQYAKYLNRFGPGAVIYWFGFYEGLEDLHPDVLVLGDIPDSSDILQLRQLPLLD